MINKKYIKYILLLIITPIFASNYKNTVEIPTIQFAKKVYDLSNIEMFKKYNCDFGFKNVGSGMLTIDNIKSSCGCIQNSILKKEYKSNETGEINITLEPPKQIGEFEKKLVVFSNDPSNRQIELLIKGSVTCEVIQEPEKLLIPLKGKTSEYLHFSLSSKDGQMFSINKIISNNDCVGAVFDPNQLSSSHEVKIIPDYSKYSKENIGKFTIELSHPECSRLLVQYSILPEYSIAPESIIIQDKDIIGKTISKEISIQNNYGEPFDIKSIHSLKDLFVVKDIKKTSEGVKLWVEYNVDDKMSDTKYIGDNISIEIEDGNKYDVRCIIFNF